MTGTGLTMEFAGRFQISARPTAPPLEHAPIATQGTRSTGLLANATWLENDSFSLISITFVTIT